MSLVRREFTMLCRLQENGWCRVEFEVNVQLFVGSCCRMLILACSASPQQPVCWPDALNERRNFFYCCCCIVRSVHELPRNGSGSVASY